tara:strand:- start:400 stop:1125 length:726 start_codon:yes stop_codon:yes gene_type:complete
MPSHQNKRDRITPSQALMMGKYVQLSEKQNLSPEDQQELEYLSVTLSNSVNSDLIRQALTDTFGVSLIEVQSVPSVDINVPRNETTTGMAGGMSTGMAGGMSGGMAGETNEDQFLGQSNKSMNLRSDTLSQLRSQPAYDLGFRDMNTKVEMGEITPNSPEMSNVEERAESLRNQLSGTFGYGSIAEIDNTDPLKVQELGQLEYLEYLSQLEANREREELMSAMDVEQKPGTGLVEEQPIAQ